MPDEWKARLMSSDAQRERRRGIWGLPNRPMWLVTKIVLYTSFSRGENLTLGQGGRTAEWSASINLP